LPATEPGLFDDWEQVTVPDAPSRNEHRSALLSMRARMIRLRPGTTAFAVLLAQIAEQLTVRPGAAQTADHLPVPDLSRTVAYERAHATPTAAPPLPTIYAGATGRFAASPHPSRTRKDASNVRYHRPGGRAALGDAARGQRIVDDPGQHTARLCALVSR
jgi:hypothetical protein